MRKASVKLIDNKEVLFVFIEEVWGRMGELRMAYSASKGYHTVNLDLVGALGKPSLEAWYEAFQDMGSKVDSSNVTVIEGVI